MSLKLESVCHEKIVDGNFLIDLNIFLLYCSRIRELPLIIVVRISRRVHALLLHLFQWLDAVQGM